MSKHATLDWERIKKSRTVTFIALYLPVQFGTFVLFTLIHLIVPSSIWCEADTTSELISHWSRTACGAKQWAFLAHCSIAVSALVGLYGFLFPNRVAGAFKNVEKSRNS